MVVNNTNNKVTYSTPVKKTLKGYKYLIQGKKGEFKYLMLIQQIGERSWAGTSIDDGGAGYLALEVTGNSSTILQNAVSYFDTFEILGIPYGDKATYRRLLMEYVCYGTFGETMFDINKMGEGK